MHTNKEGGVDKAFRHSLTAPDEAAASRLYKETKARLLNVNEWRHYAGKGTAVFQRMDGKGLALTGTIAADDYIRIDIPGPGHFDWVQVEEMGESPDRIFFRVRPCADPTTEGDSTAHFLSDAATSTFIVEKAGLEVSARVVGKNEQPNTDGETLLEKARDILVSLGAIAGASDIQWSRLVKGLLESGND